MKIEWKKKLECGHPESWLLELGYPSGATAIKVCLGCALERLGYNLDTENKVWEDSNPEYGDRVEFVMADGSRCIGYYSEFDIDYSKEGIYLLLRRWHKDFDVRSEQGNMFVVEKHKVKSGRILGVK